jgi:hypothetical protein
VAASSAKINDQVENGLDFLALTQIHVGLKNFYFKFEDLYKET